MPGKPSKRAPQARRHHAVGKILGETFDRRTCNAGLVEGTGIAPDDFGDRLTRAIEPLPFERLGHVTHVVIQTDLRDEGARGDGEEDNGVGLR